MNQCFPTAFHWTLLSSGMNARWRQESFVSASLSCPSFKQTGNSKALQVCLGASAGVQLLSSRILTCRVVAFHPAQSNCEISISKTPRGWGELSPLAVQVLRLEFALQHPQRCETGWHPHVNPVLARQGQRDLCGSLTHTCTHRNSVGSVWIPQFTFLPPKFIQWLERTVGFPPSKKKRLIMLNFMAQVRMPLHSLVFGEGYGTFVWKVVRWSGHLLLSQQISSIQSSSCWP